MGTTIKFPEVNVPITGSNASIPPTGQKVLFIGQAKAPATTTLRLERNTPVGTTDLEDMFGARSMLFDMLFNARKLNKDCQFDALVVPLATGNQAVGAITIANNDDNYGVNVTPTSITVSGGNLATVASTAHGLITGDFIKVSGASPSGVNGEFPVTFIDANNYSYPVVAVANGAATGTIVINKAGYAQSGSLTFWIGSQKNFEYEISTSGTETRADIATLIQNVINADARSQIAATVDGVGGVILTYNLNGEMFNETPMRSEDELSIGGMNSTMTAFSGGTENPDILTALDLIGVDERYQTVVYPYNGDIDTIKDFLDARFNADGTILDGVAITGKTDTYANLLAYGDALNSNSVVVLGTERTGGNAYSDIIEYPWIIAAEFAAIRSLRLQDGSNIAQYVITAKGALDAIGGAALCSKPYANTPMPLLVKSWEGLGFEKSEIADLNDAGITVLGNNKSNSAVILGQVVTTYKFTNSGDPDITYKYLNYVDTASTGREFIFNSLARDNSQTRLTSGSLIKGRSMTNAETIAANMVGYYQTLAESDFMVARKGEDELSYFKDNLSVTADLETGTATATFSLPIITQLRKINAPMAIAFNLV